jgi:AmiR/NasT family two-component response regulator
MSGSAALQASNGRSEVVEQAKEAMSMRLGLSPDEAFELLHGLARSQRRDLHEFAGVVVRDGGRLDGAVVGASGQPLNELA